MKQTYPHNKVKDSDFIGKSFNGIAIIKEVETHTTPCGTKKRRVLCRCHCGNIHVFQLMLVMSGRSKSCGCNQFGHRATHGMQHTRIYKTWQGIKKRCDNSKEVGYKNYGGRGITYDKKWKTFEGFYEDMKDGYSNNLTIDRINNEGSYNKSNCKWSTKKEQARNTRANVNLTFKGLTMSRAEWGRFLGLGIGTIGSRINRLGWSIEKALTTGTILNIF